MRDCCEQLSPKHWQSRSLFECRHFEALALLAKAVTVAAFCADARANLVPFRLGTVTTNVASTRP